MGGACKQHGAKPPEWQTKDNEQQLQRWGMRHVTLLRYCGGMAAMVRAGGGAAAAYCTIWALLAMLLSFRALMALTILFLLLLVEGWDESARYTLETHTYRCISATSLWGLMLLALPLGERKLGK